MSPVSDDDITFYASFQFLNCSTVYSGSAVGGDEGTTEELCLASFYVGKDDPQSVIVCLFWSCSAVLRDLVSCDSHDTTPTIASDCLHFLVLLALLQELSPSHARVVLINSSKLMSYLSWQNLEKKSVDKIV
ncbi:hypothetical protein F511_39504 [Dorcoceras hygrometricum]|uniref:Uncharacterized protein n=1 Tax=Dorcoceras hygrometricum TaxID=472368 RepID=A0A2Z7CSU7_9LAMI|nr:hypothetical protein F511_39504 [Dorcoceras hygrometricum]